MIEVGEAMPRAAEHMTRLVHQISEHRWDAPTPCSEWDVRALLNHLVWEHRWALPLMEGKTVADVGDSLDGDMLGNDPKGAWDDAIAASLAKFGEPGAMERTVHLSFADVPGEEYAFQMTVDLVVHGWDLARGIGADERIADDLVTLVYERSKPSAAAIRGSGVFGSEQDVPFDADEQTRMLAFFGRKA
jgi:uncharacterized protein (TIGR03086 family)